jgi:hypothetical protein
LGLDWHSIGCCQPRLFWQVEIGSIESSRPTSSVQAYMLVGLEDSTHPTPFRPLDHDC